MKKRVNVFAIAVLLIISTAAFSTDKSTYELVLSGKSCKESSLQSIDCDYRVGKDLHITIAGIGQPDTGITFVKSSFDGDFYATFGMRRPASE